MPTTMYGWVEARWRKSDVTPPYNIDWQGVIKADSVVIGHYDMYSCLFGVTDYAQFEPVAPNRGLPPDISEQATDEYSRWENPFCESWVTWAEIMNVDWDEQALDRRPHEYERDLRGQLVYTGKGIHRSMARPYYEVEEGDGWEHEGSVFKVERIARRDALNTEWELLFRLMNVLADEVGSENVRLVVWFDN